MKATKNGLKALNTRRGQAAVAVFALLLILICCALTLKGWPPTKAGEAEKVAWRDAYGRLPLYFAKNEGQLSDVVKYYERGLGHAIFFKDDEIVFHLEKGREHPQSGMEGEARDTFRQTHQAEHNQEPAGFSQVRLFPVGMHQQVKIEGLEPQEGKVNYFLGKDPASWKTDIPTYLAVVYQGAYPGIDLKFYGSNERLEYDVLVQAGADPSRVKFGYSGIHRLTLSDAGDLRLELPDGGTLIHRKPVAYQVIDGQRQEVEGTFVVEPFPGKASEEEEASFVFGFKLASYNSSYPLIIDPVLVYSTYLGGTSSDAGNAIAVDAQGCAYVTGRTYSTAFPTAAAYDTTHGGGADAFVTKLNATGTGLVYSTYIGGSSTDIGYGIAVDASGYVYLTGETSSTDFPTKNAYLSGLGSAGISDAFVVKLNAAGSALIYATYLGGASHDIGLGIAVDSSGLAYVTGETSSNDFPLAGNALQSIFGGGYADAFVTKFTASGNDVTFSTYIGGYDSDSGYGIAVDSSNIYVAGETASSNFPTTGSVQTIYGGGDFDAFVVKINKSTMGWVYATFLGGSGADYGRSIAVDTDGTACVTGTTSSTDFPLANAFQSTSGGGEDAFVTKLGSLGDSFTFSTYLGGPEDDVAYAIAVDAKGNFYVTGKTSGSFPVTKAIQSVYGGGGSDAFVARIDTAESEIAYSTYLGGTAVDVGNGIATGTGGNVYITGSTSSYYFPTTDGAYSETKSDGYDVFVSKINALLADFSADPTTGTYPLEVNFTDLSEGSITSWEWDFGDGEHSTSQNPTKTYNTSGTYTVSLTVTGAEGEDTKTRSGYIKVAVPEVTIAATTARVPETGGGTGQFTVTRSAYTTVPLTVSYTVGGTATGGADFETLSGSVTIPQGASSATITVTPIWDKFNDGNETVIVTLASSTLYSIGSPGAATLTILDYDLPTVTVSASITSVSEKSPQYGLFVVSRAGLTTSALTVFYTTGGTGVAGTDYTALSGSVLIPAGSTSASVFVYPLWDQVFDGDKTVVLTISSNSSYTYAAPYSATVTVVDSDLPTVTIEAAVSSISESGTATGEYVVTHTGTTDLPLIVKYTAGGTAVKDTNYVALSGSVTIPAGSSSNTITLTPKHDNQYTGDLTVVVSLASSSSYTIGTPSAATITIVESDVPTVTVTATQPNATEATIAGQFTVTRSGITASPLTVAYTTTGTAAPDVNYTALTGTVTIAAGSATATIAVQPLDETLWQGPTTVILTLTSSTLYKIGSPESATVTIADNDGPTVTVAATRPTVAEGDTGKGQFTVTRSAHTDVALTVTYTVSGTATDGTDYVHLPGSMTIPAGYASGSILVAALTDDVSDGDKTVIVTITSSEWYKVGIPSSATVTILDSDLPTLTIAASVSKVMEKGSQTAQFVVTRVGLLTPQLVVNYTTGGTAVSGVDYTAPSGSVTMASGSATATIAVTPLADGIYDGNQTLVLTLAGSSMYNVGLPASASAIIVDQDVPTVTVTASIPTVDETASSYAEFLFTHSGITLLPLTVTYSVSGTASGNEDYTALTGTVIIPAGSSSASVRVEPMEDLIPDDAETVIVTLVSNASYLIGSSKTATVTIFESGTPTVNIVATTPMAKEGGVNGVFTITRSKKTTESLTVNYSIEGTAVPNGQYTALPTSVTIPVGSPSATISVQAIDNSVWQGATTVILTLLDNELVYEVGSESTATVTIADNDGPSIEMEAIVAKRVGYEAGPVAAQLKVYRQATSTTGNVPVAYSLGGTATRGVDYVDPGGTVIIPDGSASAIIEIMPINDDIDEAQRETVTVTLIENGWYTIGWNFTDTVYIADDDLPTATITVVDENAYEADNREGLFRVARDGITTSSLVVYYTVGGTAVNGGRYQKLNGSVSLSAGSSYNDIRVIPYNDSSYQGNETVTVTLFGTELYNTGLPSNATVTIRENDLPTITVAAPVGTIDESGTTSGVFRVSRNGNAVVAPPLQVNYTLAGTAVYGADFETSSTNSVTIPAGANSVDIEIIPLDNENVNGTRAVILTLAAGTDYTPGTSNAAVVSIIDDEMASVSILAIDDLASENATDTGTFRIFRSGNLTDPLEVTLTIEGTALPGTHYSALPNSVTIPAGGSSVDLVVSAIQDQTAQTDKTVILTIASSAAYYVGSPNQAKVTITDDETPIVSITAVRNATESGTKGQFEISRMGNSRSDLVVKFEIGGTAVENVNYETLSRRITIPAGKASRILSVSPIDDDQMTGDLTLEVTLTQTAKYLLGSSTTASIAITDTDLPEVTVVATDPYAYESGLDKGIFTITRTRVTNSPLTVKFSLGGTAKAGKDYKALTGSVKIPKNQASQIVQVVPINDNQTDVTRTVELTIKPNAAYFVGTPSTATVNLADNDLPEVSLTVLDNIAAKPVDSGAADTGEFRISRLGATTNPLTVKYTIKGTATNKTDYEKLTGKAIIPVGASSVNVKVTPLATGEVLTNETVILTLAQNAAYSRSESRRGTVVILGDTLPEVNVVAKDASASETGPSPGTFTVTRTGSTTSAITIAVTLSGTATNGKDYVKIANEVNIPRNYSYADITLMPIADTTAEGSETVILTIKPTFRYRVGSASSATITITDN